MNNDTSTEIKEPTFSELRNEAISSIHRLLKGHNGVIEPEAVLHLGMFLAMLDGKASPPVEPLEIEERYYKEGHDIINALEHQANEYGDMRMVQLSVHDISTLRNALEVLHDKGAH